ncbi:hypothetical protein [Noviherbaspirillum pedocola]|uniref:Uncharacterized protein n=1 Tax=Noviherbaspirillum pedocola TaxID=2801341 RepID=A0A934W8V2_9BURK|nr:hypothetical protein [Noviherbaspirillum pedocola]MBK4738025.1 hypothetical protein [Noviherbaspirillum pedocola]
MKISRNSCIFTYGFFLIFLIATMHKLGYCFEFGSAYEGVYVMPGKATVLDPVSNKYHMVKNATDCLVMRKISESEVRVYLSTIQERGYSCYLEGEAQVENGKLVMHIQDDEKDNNGFQGVYIKFNGKKIFFEVTPGAASNFCGIHASLRGLAFDVKKKTIPWRKNNNVSDELLSKYCPKWNR